MPKFTEQGVLIAIAIGGVVLYAGNAAIPLFTGLDKASQLGDAFGAINAFFAGAAFFGVIYAILLQKEELGLQRRELEQTREELAGQKEQLALQSATFRQQSFDNTFFQLLSFHHQIVSSMDLAVRGEPIRGQDCFVRFLRASCA